MSQTTDYETPEQHEAWAMKEQKKRAQRAAEKEALELVEWVANLKPEREMTRAGDYQNEEEVGLDSSDEPVYCHDLIEKARAIIEREEGKG